MEKYLIYLLAGFCGGIVRGLVGFVKNKTIEKADHFKQIMSQSFRLLPNISQYAVEILGWSKSSLQHLQA